MHQIVQLFLIQFRLMKVIRKMIQMSNNLCKRCKLCKLCPKPQKALKRSPSEEADLRAPKTGLHENLA